jgi:hypothetical protein
MIIADHHESLPREARLARQKDLRRDQTIFADQQKFSGHQQSQRGPITFDPEFSGASLP